ncbi:MAG: hypothetical protein CVU64_24690 [Deltaproteobacteria bacterium HGW-Deltaproteobacteria-21]|nr:MAG: hypothetical protein CVU64_24690 [Deltaproteobacteria bacterium HGW-Deltaproteobacteria-21]
MEKLLSSKWSAYVVAFLFVLFGSLDCADAKDYDVSGLSKERQESWSRTQAQLKRELATCQEHCGGSGDCDAKCQKAHDARLEIAYQRLTQGEAVPKGDIQQAPSCPFCGMDRQKFAHSRAFVEYDDGSILGTCSIHCAAVDMAVNIDKTPVRVWVGDYITKELIDAESAIWVMGGNKMGVMTKRAKWAFGTREEAEQFVKQEGGTAVGFEAAMKASFEDMYEDTRMIRERRKAKRMSGEKVPVPALR